MIGSLLCRAYLRLSYLSLQSRALIVSHLALICRSTAQPNDMPSLQRKVKSSLYARVSRAHADADAYAEAEAADQNNFVNNSQANDNGQQPPPPVPPKDKSKNSIVFHHPFSSPHHRRRDAIDLSTTVESRLSIQTREKQTQRTSSSQSSGVDWSERHPHSISTHVVWLVFQELLQSIAIQVYFFP